ncbi:DUF1345 domain-containing protein [Sphingomonas sp. CJ20]
MSATRRKWHIGHVVAPPRFLTFLFTTAIAGWFTLPALGWRYGIMVAFDVGATVFLLACLPLLRHESDRMRQSASQNDANRVVLLMMTVAVSFVILIAIASELMDAKKSPDIGTLAMIVGTLALTWTFSNTVYALHYAHLFYQAGDDGDAGGLEFPKTPEPDYWDFVYFAFCLGMTFQTSDVTITQVRVRRPVTLHCLAAFVFNLGVIAFSINVLGGGG